MPMPNDKKRAVIEAVVATFETGDPYGGYDAVAMLDDGAGISYGKHQATDHADNLDLMCFRYVDRGGLFADELEPYLVRLDADETAKYNSKNYPQWIADLMGILRRAGAEDPIMRRVQDEVFNERYWEPGAQHCTDMQLKLPMSWLLVYDTCIHSGPAKVTTIRKWFSEVPPSRGGDEKEWTKAFAKAREHWLLNYENENEAKQRTVRGSASRVTRMIELMNAENWRLKTPFRLTDPLGNYDVVIGEAQSA